MKIRRIAFVCLGNICRSPLAEALARAEIARRGLDIAVESHGTSAWHVGEPPDERMQRAARRRGIDLSNLRATQITVDRATELDLIVAMDEKNQQDLGRIFAGHSIPIVRLVDFHVGADRDVPDPYTGGPEAFDRVFDLVKGGVHSLLDAIAQNRIL